MIDHGHTAVSSKHLPDGASGRGPATVPGRRNLVVGLGQTGMSCVRYLASRGEALAIADSRERPPELDSLSRDWPDVHCYCGAFTTGLLDGIDRVVLSPGVDRREPLISAAIDRGIPVVGDVELFALELRSTQPRARVVGITGTNGKSTVTALVAAMTSADGIAVRSGANFGPPALDLLEEPRPVLYVLELSSFQLESTDSLSLEVAALLNVTPDHLDRYSTVDSYAAAKARIFRHAVTAVVNADDPALRSLVPAGLRTRWFSVTGAAEYFVDATRDPPQLAVLEQGAEMPVVALEALRIGGRHNAANALAALAIGDSLGLSRAAMVATLREFAGLAHRMQLVARVRGVDYVNDSKGTNVGATLAAVRGIDRPVILIAGGDGKGQDFGALAAAFKGRVRHAVLLGRDRELLAAALDGACSTEFAADMAGAVIAAAARSRFGDVVLLSPACASLDMYRNYAARGDAFAKAVLELRQ